MENFSRRSKTPHLVSSYCRKCEAKRCLESYYRNREIRLLSASQWKKKNKDRCRALARESYARNKETRKAKVFEYIKENREKHNAWTKVTAKRNPSGGRFRVALRRARIKRASPMWTTKEMITDIKFWYRLCPKGWHVDHIHPLGGKKSSGLHVPWNLQVLPASLNLAKWRHEIHV
jgi:hypothetical protein